MNDYEFVKRFSKISISKLCKKLGISRTNVYGNSISKEKIKALRTEIESELAKLYLKEEYHEKDSSL